MIHGYIYKLFCLDTGEMYFGSTTNLKKRKSQHTEKDNKCVSKQIINRNNYIFIILQEGKYINLDHLKAIENSYIEKLPCINLLRSFSCVNESAKRTYDKNKYNPEFKLKKCNYYKNNREKLVEKLPCKFCAKNISKPYMPRHVKICKKSPF